MDPIGCRPRSLRIALLTALCLAGCESARPAAAEQDLATGAALPGKSHPASGAYSPVGEAGWGAATWALGGRFTAGEGSGLQIAIYSQHATAVLLELYTASGAKDASFDYWMKRGPDSIWRAQVAKVPGKTRYAFRVWGPNWPLSAAWRRGNSSAGFVSDVDGAGNRFNPNKVLFDPYARELDHDRTSGLLIAAGETVAMFGTGGADVGPGQTYTGPATSGVAIDRRNVDTGRTAIKGLVFVDTTGTGVRPHLPQKDAAIYEAHVRGLTAHPSASRLAALLKGFTGFEKVVSIPIAARGTYRGAGLMAPYLKALGYTTIELLPIMESDNEQNPARGPGGNYWGYMTYGWFAPDRRYSSDPSPGGPTREFKQMVAAFHAAGLEVYLDVVYNHSGEGGTWDQTRKAAELTSLRGLDNATYYALSAADRSAYFDTTGCGNNLDASQPAVAGLIEDSLGFWSSEMGVDGFRFDEAPELGRDRAPNYDYNRNAHLLTDIAALAAANDLEVIAEPWDAQTYQVGNFPAGWGQWNGRYRDAVRRYVKGDLSGSGGATWTDVFHGDYSAFSGAGGPHKSVNLLDAHDGFTLADLVSYDSKTNAARGWPFGPSDGGNDSNDSSSWGGDQALRRQMVRNLLAFQIMSRGVPMHVQGDELGRTQNGNDNPYDVDSVATWNNYDMVATDAPQAVPTGDTTGGAEAYHQNLGTDARANGKNDLFLFTKYLLGLRRAHPALRQADYSMPIAYARPDGSAGFDSRRELAGLITLSGSAIGDQDFLVLSNMSGGNVSFTVPPAQGAANWVRLVDTAAALEPAGNAWDAAAGTVIVGNYGVNPRSIVVLLAR